MRKTRSVMALAPVGSPGLRQRHCNTAAPSFPRSQHYSRMSQLVSAKREFAFLARFQLHFELKRKEVCHGTRTLAAVVSVRPHDCHGLSSKVRADPTLDHRADHALGSSSRSAGRLGLRPSELEYHDTATSS